jgi:hypothetical protein
MSFAQPRGNTLAQRARIHAGLKQRAKHVAVIVMPFSLGADPKSRRFIGRRNSCMLAIDHSLPGSPARFPSIHRIGHVR